jgi:hypothetical protein
MNLCCRSIVTLAAMTLLVDTGRAASPAPLPADAAADAAHTPDRVRVLVDRSHQWLFAHDDVAYRMLQPRGFDVVLCDASLDTKEKLRDYDIVMFQQVSEAGPFAVSDAEIALLKDYVAGGGKLLLVANPKCPAGRLATAFGFSIMPAVCKLPLRPEAWLRRSFGAEAELRTGPMSYRIDGPLAAVKVICDQTGAAVALKSEYGKGAVLCFADDATYWDFCAQRDARQQVPNVPTTVALFRCLVPDKRPGGQRAAVRSVRGERELKLGALQVFYSNPVAACAQPLLEKLPKVVSLVEKANGRQAPDGYFGMHILASGGGGWAGERDIGVQCGGNMYGNVSVIAHELTHILEGPLPGVVGEGWASMVGWRVGAQLGYRHEADAERSSWLAQSTNYEKNGKSLDITLAESDRALFGPCEGKLMGLVEQLEAAHGPDFMPRFLRLRHAVYGRKFLNIQEVLHLFSRTAGRDCTAEFRRLGITVSTPPISPDELPKRIDAPPKTP